MNKITQPVLSVQNLNFYYAHRAVLHNISLDFEMNQITAIIGPSGSGKSTFLRVFNRIYELYPHQHAEGKVLFEGKNILDHSTNLIALRKKIGMAFQKPMPFPMSIYNNVAFPVKLNEKVSRKELDERVEMALRQCALWDEVKDKLHDSSSHLSGGQQQRLCVARTISTHPKILLLDEPTSALDPIATKKVEQLILELKEKYTIIIVTHNLKQAKRLSDHTIFMQNGKLIEYGLTEDIFNNPKVATTRHYIDEY